MAKRVILAVAGAGKTYYICQNIKTSQRNLILAYTNENVKNIKNELKNLYCKIPKSTTIMTFDAFVYRYMILPYNWTISKFFSIKNFKCNGITIADPPSNRIKKKFNPFYIKNDKINYYLTEKFQYYCSRLTELILKINCDNFPLLDKLAKRINLFYDCVYIDEFQDFRRANYEFIIEVSKRLNNIVLVGDYYQHSVLGKNNNGIPFVKDSDYNDFVCELKKQNFNVDDELLSRSIRCSEAVCKFVKKKLGINIESNGYNLGDVIFVKKENIISVLNNDSIKKLVHHNAKKYSFNTMNWSYSKGSTFDDICVILLSKYENLDSDNFSLNSLDIVTRNKLYVALTRCRHNLYLIKESLFKEFKDKYLK